MQDRQTRRPRPVTYTYGNPSRSAARPGTTTRSTANGRPSASARPAARRPQATRTGVPVRRPGQGNRAPQGRRPVKRQSPGVPAWVKAIPGKLAALPGKFIGLFGSWYYRIYFPVVILAFVAMILGWNWLEGFASDYEASQPFHVADQVSALFTGGDFNRIYELDASAPELSGGNREFYVDSLNQLVAGKAMDCQSVFSSDKNTLVYNVTLDGAKFATFTLVPSGQTSAHGNTLWRLGSVATNIVLQNSEKAPKDPFQAPYHIQALPEYTVYIDGNPLTTADIIQEGIKTLPDGFLPKGVTAPTMVEYGFYSDSETPQITVTAPDGAQLTAVEDSENIWVCGFREDEALKAEYSDAIVKLAWRIAKYTTQDVSRETALQGVEAESPAEEIIKSFSNRWAPTHKEESYENMTVSNFYVLSDNCLTCHVSFDYILTSKRGNDYTYPTEYTFCILRGTDGGKLYNLVFH